MPICPKCQIEYKEGFKFCGECGANLFSKEEAILSVEKKGIEVSEKSLICPNCNLAYEFGEICIQCGSPLGSSPQGPISPPPSTEDLKRPPSSSPLLGEVVQEKRKRLICPNCKLIYERSTFCIRCGSSLVEELPQEEKKHGETKPQEEVEPKETEPTFLKTKKDTFLQKDESQPKERKITPKVDSKKKPSPLQPSIKREEETFSFYDEEGLWGIETSEKQTEKKTITQMFQGLRFPKKSIKKIRGISFQMVTIVILIVAVGYLLWSIYSLVSPKTPKLDIPTSNGYFSIAQPSPPASVPSIPSPGLKENVPPSSPSSAEGTSTPTPISEREEVKQISILLETIRHANLQKDIDLFMSCYSSTFKDRESKRKSTLENWKSFNYLDLSYDLKNHSLSEDKASIRVEWTIRFTSKPDGQPKVSKTLLDVTLKKEGGRWKIKEILPIS